MSQCAAKVWAQSTPFTTRSLPGSACALTQQKLPFHPPACVEPVSMRSIAILVLALRSLLRSLLQAAANAAPPPVPSCTPTLVASLTALFAALTQVTTSALACLTLQALPTRTMHEQHLKRALDLLIITLEVIPTLPSWHCEQLGFQPAPLCAVVPAICAGRFMSQGTTLQACF